MRQTLLLALLSTGIVGLRAELPAFSASQAPRKIEKKGPLAGLPSQPGPHVARIKALGDNEWLDLGSPAPDPQWGKATGRSWGGRMPYAPDLGGAFLCGEGPHQYIKPNGYRDDDLWVYDMNAHRWICLHPGTNTRTFNQQVKDKDLRIDGEGRIVDKTGQPIPVHLSVHAWGNLTYNTDQRKFAFYASQWNCGSYFLSPTLEEGAKLLAAQGLNRKPGGPWFYDVATGRFENHPATGSAPEIRGEPATNQFIYIPSKRLFLCAGKEGTAYFDPATNAWTAVATKGKGPRGIDHSACYDPKRDRVYMGGGGNGEAAKPGDNFWMYDVKSATWSRPDPKGVFPQTFGPNHAFFNFDTVNDSAVIVGMAAPRQVFAYNPDTNTWTSPPPTGPQDPRGTGNGFYSPELNAYFFHVASDGAENGTLWAYRYKKATK